ncbi:MAG: 2,3-bisphosphoglycerate-independent phosphoglycerate mutase [Alphaproteobacteria bacterium]|nr:2,3-bisphosphoglycerate-independent phosphoglycerate mutase [Alphaproteobacteria bacterium]OJV13577.1 MAG: phosphoglycerate mutase (2,3-diphosphoglycerate-independent) [Alphaproteobacteria bacterium 33-17]
MQKVLLCILDGFGLAPSSKDNAITSAETPFFDEAFSKYPYARISTSGLDVGLPEGQMGNSEVGHMSIGSGRIILQDLPKINDAIETGSVKGNKVIKQIIEKYTGSENSFHLMGLLSDGGVHSHQDHMIYIAKYLAEQKVDVKIHAFLDGRDTPPQSAKIYLENLQKQIQSFNNISIATIAGRYYAMDRDKRWDRVEKAYNAIVLSSGDIAENALDVLENSYRNQVLDEFVIPTVIGNYKGIQDGDGFLFTNFRADRARQLSHALIDQAFDKFERKKVINFGLKSGMMEYSDLLAKSMDSVFPNEEVLNTLPQVLADNNLKQLRIAETEKYAHVTFFFNGGVEKVLPGEDRVLIPSPKVATYDEIPEMSAYDLTEKLVDEIETEKYDFIAVNYANCDMVGHTGNFKASVEAVETIDKCVKDLSEAALKHDYIMLITADHGNVEQMENGEQAHTSHTLNPVPLIILTKDKKIGSFGIQDGRLCDVAPTILEIMNIKTPVEMTGKSLLIRGS